MALQDNENPSLPVPRLSPGEAAFERLKRREALKAKDSPASIEPTPQTATKAPKIEAPPEAAEAVAAEAVAAPAVVAAAPPGPAAVAASDPAAAEFIGPPVRPAGFPPAFIATAPAPEPQAQPSPALDERDQRIIAVAAALGIADDLPGAKADTPSAADAAAEKLEAALLDQLKSLEATLKLPKAMPLRPSRINPKAEEPGGPPRRSVFAPDPVRQRTYVDLRDPAPEPEPDAIDPPWRKYLAAPPRAARQVPANPPRHRTSPRSATVAAIHASKAEAEERGRGIRALSAAAVLGLGVGLGLVVLMRPFADATISSVPGPETVTADSVAIAASNPGIAGEPARPVSAGANEAVGQALATLLAEPPVSRPAPGQPAVIAEPGAPPDAVAAAAPAPVVTAASQPPVVIRPPPGEAQRVARVPDFDGAGTGPLAYVPSIPSYDPVRQSLLEEEAAVEERAAPPGRTAARTTATDRPAAAPVRSGRATINTFVNMRSKPDNAAPIVAILADGLSVKVIACDYWCEVEAGGKRGFVFKKFVSR